MKALAKAQAVRISPRKVSPVAVLVQGKSVEQAKTILEFTPQRAAGIIAKALNSAAANATNNHGLKAADLTVEKVLVGPGPTFKRFRPKARGAAYPLLKYSSHITVILTDDVSPKNQELNSKATTSDLDLSSSSLKPMPKAKPKKEAK